MSTSLVARAERPAAGRQKGARKPPRSKTRFASRAEVIAAVMPVFRKYGLDGATLSVITEEIGLQRSSLYHHFPEGKDEMAAACLAQVETEFEARVFAVLRSDALPEQRIRAVTRELRAYYEDGRMGCLFAAFALENSRARFKAQLDRMLHAWIEATAKLFRDQGQDERAAREAAEEVVCAIQGALIVAPGLGSNKPFLRAVKQLWQFTGRRPGE